MLVHQLTFAGIGVAVLKVEVALQPCLSLWWWFTSTCGLATWAGMLELVWDTQCALGSLWTFRDQQQVVECCTGPSTIQPRLSEGPAALIPPALPSARDFCKLTS